MPRLGHALTRLYRTHIHAGERYSPDRDRLDLGLLAFRLDRGNYPVIASLTTSYAPLGVANRVGGRIRHMRALFLLSFSWSMRSKARARELTTAIQVYETRRPNHRILVLCNEVEELHLLKAAGARAVHCNQNAFVDEQTFRPIARERLHDAIYNAAITPWKRHSLARLVPSCLHVFYKKDELDWTATKALLEELKAMMPDHRFLNSVLDGEIEMIDGNGVNEALASCRTGLCLSAAEGAMFASMEYLLAGLPVVSTRNVGGRDVFADPEYWITVDPTAEAVAGAVSELIGRNISPERVRSRTIERVHEHRRVLKQAVEAVTDGAVQLPSDPGDPAYRHPILWQRGDPAERLGLPL